MQTTDQFVTKQEQEILTSKEFEDTLLRDNSFLVKLKIRKKESSKKAKRIREINGFLNEVIQEKNFGSTNVTILRDQFRIFLDANSTNILFMGDPIIKDKINELVEKQAKYISKDIKEIINQERVESYLNEYSRSSAEKLDTKYLDTSFKKSLNSFKQLLGISGDLNEQEKAMLQQLVKITFDEQVEKYTPIRSLDWKRRLRYDEGEDESGGSDQRINGYNQEFSRNRELIALKEFRLRNFFSRKIKQNKLKSNQTFVCYSFFEIYLESHQTTLQNVSDYEGIINKIIKSVKQMELPKVIDIEVKSINYLGMYHRDNSFKHLYGDYSYDSGTSYILRDKISLVMGFNHIKIPEFLYD